MEIKSYISKIVENNKQEDMQKLSDMLSEVICKIKEYHHDMYEHYKMCLYEIAYGKTINDEMRKEIVDRIGEEWSLEETEELRKKYGYTEILPNDFNVVMNMAYSDYKDIFGDDVEIYVKFSKCFIEDEDAKEGKVYLYFKNIPKED